MGIDKDKRSPYGLRFSYITSNNDEFRVSNYGGMKGHEQKDIIDHIPIDI